MSQESETAVKDINDFYNEAFNKVSQEIIEGAKEGFKEGLRAGIKSGLQEITGLGFVWAKAARSLSEEDILRDAAAGGLKNMTSTITKRNVCPIMKSWLGNQCDEAVGILVAKGSIKTAQDATHLAGYLKLEEAADKKYQEMSDQAKVGLPSSFIADALFKGVQETLWDCAKDGIKSCQKRISEMKVAQETT
jgi:hypothetical protein